MNRAAGLNYADTGQCGGHSGSGRRDRERCGSINAEMLANARLTGRERGVNATKPAKTTGISLIRPVFCGRSIATSPSGGNHGL